MPEKRCPGQDQRYWTPEDICTVPCPYCSGEIEFWKDEPFRACPSCRKEVRNPRQPSGCASWCKHGCHQSAPEDKGPRQSDAPGTR